MFGCARNNEGSLTGGQVIHLNDNGEKNQNQDPVKKSYGVIKKSYVCLSHARWLEENFAGNFCFTKP